MSQVFLPGYPWDVLPAVISRWPFAISAILVILAITSAPIEAPNGVVRARFGHRLRGFHLYYATSFIFTGLAVMVAYHAGLFNIGGEG